MGTASFLNGESQRSESVLSRKISFATFQRGQIYLFPELSAPHRKMAKAERALSCVPLKVTRRGSKEEYVRLLLKLTQAMGV